MLAHRGMAGRWPSSVFWVCAPFLYQYSLKRNIGPLIPQYPDITDTFHWGLLLAGIFWRKRAIETLRLCRFRRSGTSSPMNQPGMAIFRLFISGFIGSYRWVRAGPPPGPPPPRKPPLRPFAPNPQSGHVTCFYQKSVWGNFAMRHLSLLPIRCFLVRQYSVMPPYTPAWEYRNSDNHLRKSIHPSGNSTAAVQNIPIA